MCDVKIANWYMRNGNLQECAEETDRHTDWHTDWHINRHTDWHIDRHTDWYTDRHTEPRRSVTSCHINPCMNTAVPSYSLQTKKCETLTKTKRLIREKCNQRTGWVACR